jgi:hypothetical protein
VQHLFLLDNNDKAAELENLIALLQGAGNHWQQLQINCLHSIDNIQQEIQRLGWNISGSAVRWNLIRGQPGRQLDTAP